MYHDSFASLVRRQQGKDQRKRLALMGAESRHSLEAVAEARRMGLIEPVLVGDPAKVRDLLQDMGLRESDGFELICAETPEQAAQTAVDLVRQGKADILMKGLIETGSMMKILLKKENGLRTGHIVSSCLFMELRNYHKLVAMTDAAINVYPTPEQKRSLIISTVETMRRMGWDRPKVGLIAAVETENPKMPETTDAAMVKQMYLDGQIQDCVVEGPISVDLAIDKDAAAIKNYSSPVAGDADLLIFPNIAAGNISVKLLQFSGNQSGSMILGLKVPALLASRSASMETKLNGILLAAAAG